MAERAIDSFRPHAESQGHRSEPRFRRAFALAAVFLIASALVSCGGGVSTTDSPVSNNAPGSGPALGTATLKWTQPSTYVNGAPLISLAGYKVYYGTAPGVYTSIDVGNVSSYQVVGLTKGQIYYFTVTDYDANGVESDYSTVVSKLII